MDQTRYSLRTTTTLPGRHDLSVLELLNAKDFRLHQRLSSTTLEPLNHHTSTPIDNPQLPAYHSRHHTWPPNLQHLVTSYVTGPFQLCHRRLSQPIASWFKVLSHQPRAFSTCRLSYETRYTTRSSSPSHPSSSNSHEDRIEEGPTVV